MNADTDDTLFYLLSKLIPKAERMEAALRLLPTHINLHVWMLSSLLPGSPSSYSLTWALQDNLACLFTRPL